VILQSVLCPTMCVLSGGVLIKNHCVITTAGSALLAGALVALTMCQARQMSLLHCALIVA
jgi:hypothetical protein